MPKSPLDGLSGATSSARQTLSKLTMMIAGTAGIVGLIYGYDLGSIAGAILFLKPDFGLSDFQVALVVSAVVLGQLFGAFFAGRISNRFGRQRTLIWVALGYAVFAVLQGVAPNMEFLIAVRFLLGFGIGVSIVTAPAYIAECSPRQVRGSMLVTFQIATTSGVVVAYFVGAALAGYGSWRLMLSLSAIPAVAVLLLIVKLPETPRWLLMNKRRQEAIPLLQKLNPELDAHAEANAIEQDLAHEERGTFSELFRGRFRKAGLFVVGLGFFVQISGINAIVYYSPTIIQSVGVTNPVDAIMVTGFAQIACVMAEIASFFLVDRLGRRPTLLLGIGITAVANLILVAAFATGPSAVLAFVGILIFLIGFGLGYGSLVWIYASESFPTRLRTQGGSAMLTSDLLANFIIGVLFLNALGMLGGSFTFAIFFILAICAFLFVYWLAPETKGRPLEAIREYWYNGGRWPDESDEAEPHAPLERAANSDAQGAIQP